MIFVYPSIFRDSSTPTGAGFRPSAAMENPTSRSRRPRQDIPAVLAEAGRALGDLADIVN